MTTITEPRVVIQVMIIRHNNRYFYNRLENGHLVVLGEAISRDRAMQIHSENSDCPATGDCDAEVTFEPGNGVEWTWTATVQDAKVQP